MGKSVLIVGGGGREHALCRSLFQSKSIGDVHVTPGNAGTMNYATNHLISASDIPGLVDLSQRLGVDFVVVGPEAPLCDSLADLLLEHGIPCFGPQALHAELEGSKRFAKEAMRRANVPTADYLVLDSSSDIDSA
ncbi:MAG: phosphoribosylamine--glycine ligase, partial [Candidatus Poseidoniaceae archaeon]